MENIWKELVSGTKDFVHNAGFSKVTLGLSGGIDSAVTACIACAALGPKNVLGVMMSSPYSSDGSIVDSLELSRRWKFSTVHIPIHALMSAFDETLAPNFSYVEPKRVTAENLQARIRAVLLMALCNEHNLLLLNTCNKSEDFTGYATLYGDSCGAVAPIGDLYKTEVYELARWINANPDLPDIPEVIITKPPSAELSDGQLDEVDLMPYAELDAILSLYVDQSKTVKDAVAAGHNEKDAERVWQLMHKSEFKRQQAPPPIRLLCK